MPVTLVKSDWTSGALRFRQVTSAGQILFGEDDTGLDVQFFGATASSSMLWDESADLLDFNGADLRLQDSDILNFGDANDVQVRWDGTDLDILAAANNSIIKFGDGTTSFDVWIYGSAAANYVVWDASANDLIFQDNCSAMFGTGNDVEIRWDATDLDILGAADDQVIKIGNGTNSFDLWVYGNVAGDYILWDASASTLTLKGDAKLTFENEIVHASAKSQTKNGAYTLAESDSGQITYVDTTAVITLPSTVVGMTFTLVNAGADGAVQISLDPAAADKIMGGGFTSADNKDAINTLATAKKGDLIEVVADGVNGWYVTQMHGTWAREA